MKYPEKGHGGATSAEQVSQGIFEFLRIYMHRSDQAEDYSVRMVAAFSDTQLRLAGPIFAKYGLEVPRGIRLGRIDRAPKYEDSHDPVLARGYTYLSLDYPGRVVAYGGVLGVRNQEAPRIWKLTAVTQPENDPADIPEHPWLHPTLYADRARRLGGSVLEDLGFRHHGRQELEPAEYEFLA